MMPFQRLLQNIRYALRQLSKSPGFTFTIVITLALGIGANAAVFTLFDHVLLRMLPVEHPKELVRFEWTGAYSGSASSFGGDTTNYFSYPMYKDLRDQNQVFQGMLAAVRTNVGVSWHNQAENKDAEVVTGNYFQVLGLKPVIGRLLIQQDDTVKNANPLVVLSYDYWKTRFAASRDIVGQTILINGDSFTILGVAPETFQSVIGGYKPGVFIPISMVEEAMPWMTSRDNLNNHQSIWLSLVARLKPGVSIPQAQASLAPLWHSLRAQELTLYKSSSERFEKHFLDDSRLLVKDDSTGFSPGRLELTAPLIILMSMVGLLAVMCAINVATLLLLRATCRAREMSIRYALGAGRNHIVSQLLVESGFLGATGAVAGLAFAPLTANILVHLMTPTDPGNEPYSATIDTHVLLFTLGVSLVVILLFSIAPLLHFLRPNLTQALRQNASTASKNSQRFRKIAVGVQIALSVLLLGGAGLFMRTFEALRHQPVGFDTANLVTFSLDPTLSGYGRDRTARIVTDAIEALHQIPNVTYAAATTDPELDRDSSGAGFTVQGYKPSADERMRFETPWITVGYFAALGQPLLIGREFAPSDTQGQPKVAVVNLALAERFYGSAQNALGHDLAEGNGDGARPDTTIVGVVSNVKHQDLRTDIGPAVYRPYLQKPHAAGVQVYVRTVQTPETVEASIQQTIHGLDPTLIVDGLRTMEAQVDLCASNERTLAFLAIGFAMLAIMLASVGIYGVVAYSTEQRTMEIGVRLALGMPRSGAIMLVIREMLVISAGATVIAVPLIVALARLFSNQLYGVTTFDTPTLAGDVVVIAIMVVLASSIPARRAAFIEPVQALRSE
jgi:predicted permease